MFRRELQSLVQDNPDNYLIRHQRAPVHIGGGLQPQFGLLLQVVAEQVARTQMRNIQLFLEQLGLGTFAGTRRPEQRNTQRCGQN